MMNRDDANAVEIALRERVKELTCLYGIAQLAARPDLSLSSVLSAVGELVQAAWQYPEVAAVRICVDGHSSATPGFVEAPQRQAADIMVATAIRGCIEVVYTQPRPELDEGPFLKEERNLLDAVASQIASILERLDAEQQQRNLQGQLRHADRLATLGQLAAGVAHELNEPLGNILGFAQLLQKNPVLVPEVRADVEKITLASLRAREIIRKLLVFARQSTPQVSRVNLNHLVEDGLQLFETRCAKQGVELRVMRSADIPQIVADPSQLTQVLVNLVVNAIQAMPHGGTLTVQTDGSHGNVRLIVEDTGVGMSQEVLDQLFVPFFTTKDVGQGTGLGLSTADGIVAAHHGRILVESTLGRGSRFEVHLPADPPVTAPPGTVPSCTLAPQTR